MNKNNNNVTPDGIEGLLAKASAQLNIPPDQLKSMLQSGNLQNLGISQSQQNKINSVLSNPQMLSQVLKNPQMLQFLSNLKGK